jgi:hypothetical protein
MTQYLVAIHHPDDYDPSLDNKAMHHDISALNVEMKSVSGSSLAACQPASMAKSLRARPDGKVLTTDGPYVEAKEHVGGFWVLQADGQNAPSRLGVAGNSGTKGHLLDGGG